MNSCIRYLLLLFVLVCSTDLTTAQEYVTVGEGSETSPTLFYTEFQDAKSILTFSNSSLTEGNPSLNVGDTIYSVGWFVESLGGQAMYGAHLQIGEAGEFVTAWSGTVSPTLGWNDILLNEPYVRTGSGPLQLQYCFDNCEKTFSFNVRTTPIAGTNQHVFTDNGNGCSLTGFTTNDNRPNTRFGLSVPGATYTTETLCIGESITLSSSSNLPLNTSITGFTYHDQYDESDYFLSFNSNKNWLEADLICRQNGGHLAHISDQAENDFVQNNVINSNSWIGYYQNCNNVSYPEDTAFEWTDGTIGSYYNWGVGQPNNGTSNGEDHTVFYISGIWHDYYYTIGFPYVMEVEDSYLWNTGITESDIFVNPTATTTYWVDHTLGPQTTREYFTVEVETCGCTDPTACNYDSSVDPASVIDYDSCLYDDVCGECGGDGSTCSGCMDPTACNYDSAATIDDGSCLQDDLCGVCGGDNSSCEDCAGEPNGESEEDECGTCDNDPSNDCIQDCNGDWGGTAVVDQCGVCNGDGIPAGDCDCNGNILDECGVCNGPGAVYECGCSDIPEGECDCNGNVLDAVGECGGACELDENEDGVCDTLEIYGCMDSSSCNYNPFANYDSGECDYTCYGCTDEDACNYDSHASIDNGFCEYESCACSADLNNDGIISVSDILILLGEFGCTVNCETDINGDGNVNIQDLLIILSIFNTVC